jgi:ABC-type uncharacterized transport system ATPase subunit
VLEQWQEVGNTCRAGNREDFRHRCGEEVVLVVEVGIERRAADAGSVRNLTKDFGPSRAVDDASFDVPIGAVTGCIGANGSGKTTTMRMMLGLTPPTSGTALSGEVAA